MDKIGEIKIGTGILILLVLALFILRTENVSPQYLYQGGSTINYTADRPSGYGTGAIRINSFESDSKFRVQAIQNLNSNPLNDAIVKTSDKMENKTQSIQFAKKDKVEPSGVIYEGNLSKNKRRT